MKKFLLCFYFEFCILNYSFSQCPFNSDFEQGTTAGWVFKSGSYGKGPCPTPQPGVCPCFLTVLDNVGVIPGRHTITSSGIDPNGAVSTVDPSVTGGSYSFKLGDAIAGGIGPSCPGPPPGCYARAEAARLTFKVDTNNARFTYRYAVFIQDPGHWPEEQPRFEILVTKPDSGDKLIPCGYYKVVAGSFNPACPGTGGFLTGVGIWKYKDWTDVGLDLTNYIGEIIAIEFRTSDCFPGNGTPVVICNGNCCTTTLNGVSCIDSTKCTGGPPWCWGTPGCTNQAGSHNCYAYIDTYCQPVSSQNINVTDSFVCGAATAIICAPSCPFGCTYSWDNLPGNPTTQCVTINNLVAGAIYHVTMWLPTITACPSKASATITLECAVGVNELSSDNFSFNIIPNPTLSSFTINLNQRIKDGELVIYDMLGKELLRRLLYANNTEIQRGDLEKGIYLVRVMAADKTYLKKLVIE